MRGAHVESAGALPRTPGYLDRNEGNGFLTFFAEDSPAVQAGTPMTARSEGTASPPRKRPEARLPTLPCPAAFIPAKNIPAGGSGTGQSAGRFGPGAAR